MQTVIDIATPTAAPPRIIMVEDERVVAFHMKNQLSNLGYDVVAVAASGIQALQRIEELKPDLVIMDIRIDGELDGIETASKIPPDLSPAVIYLTAYSEETTLARARATRPYGYLLKPFSERELHATLQMALERRRADLSVRENEQKLRDLARQLEGEFDRRSGIERELRETSELLHATFDAAPFAIQVVGSDMKVMMWNASAQSMFGYESSDVIGKSMLLTVMDEFRDSVREGFSEIANGAPARRLLRQARHRDGRLLEAYVFAAPVFFPDGRIRAVVVTFEDVTDQRRTEAQLRQSQKMEAIGNLTGGLAHDFNNLLAIIVGNLDLAKVMLDGKSGAAELIELVDESLSASLRGAELTQRLLAFARRQPLSPSRLSVNELVTSTVRLMERSLGENITIVLHLTPDLWPVDADASQLEAAIVNLATNARDAMPKGGTLTIGSRNRRVDEDAAQAYPGLLPGDYVVIEVSDTGSGMTQSVAAQIFEPFFTTKEAGKGTGLGLSMVFGFMKQSGGHIDVYSEVGIGTTFRLYLPRTLTADADAPFKPREAAVAAGETILAVEDNDALRRVVVRQLRDLGYRVFEADSAAAALSFLEKENVDLVFSDVVMPGEIDGFALANTILHQYPAIKVVLTSGFPDTKLNGALTALTDQVRLLSKPYRKDELAHMLREVLER